MKNAIFPFYVSHLATFRDIKGFTTEKERELTSFLKTPKLYFDNLRAGTSSGHPGEVLKSSNAKKEITKERFNMIGNEKNGGVSALFQTIKNILKKFIPPPTNVFNREINRILNLSKKQYQGLETQISVLSNLMKQTDERNIRQIRNLEKQLTKIEDKIQKMQVNVRSCERHASEAVWADIFNNVISDSSWLKNTAFSAGRWAVGYQFLYVMYRILNEIHPQHILELGLGQSTRMIGQYVSSHEDAEHFVVEHDPEWIKFFSRDFALSERSIIIKLDLEIIPFKEAETVRAFKGFEEQFDGRKFDFISIDAPFGVDMKEYSRIDVLKLLPGCLADSFIIMIDDTERSGETNTVNAMKEQLEQSGIAFAVGRYSGEKDCTVICSENLKFVCSM